MSARSLVGGAIVLALVVEAAAAHADASSKACLRACRDRPHASECVLSCAEGDAGSGIARPIPLVSGFGLPLDDVLRQYANGSATDLQTFATGQQNFREVEDLPILGPLFNGRSCGSCDFQPTLGGSGQSINEVRIRDNPGGGPLHIFASDNLLRGGSQSQGGLTIFPTGLEATPLGCQVTAPGCALSPCQQEEVARTTFVPGLPICDPTSASFAGGANCTAERQATPLFGFGLVEAVADATLQSLASSQPPAIRGVIKTVVELGAARVARFGWKDDVATLRGFAGQAYLNEMGITNPDNPNEITSCALGQTQFGVMLDTADDPEDPTDSAGRADIDRFADFMRALAPPQLPQDATARFGRQLFERIGCNGCHTETLTTASNPAAFLPSTTGGVTITASLNGILSNRTFHPFSDFLLHDMGALGDGITSGVAGPTMMRTAPLWGIRAKSRLLHDGRAEDIPTAIALHAGQGAASAAQFGALTGTEQQALVAFLDSI